LILCTDFPVVCSTQKLHQACCEGPSWKWLTKPNSQSDPRLRDKQRAWGRCSETVGPASGLHYVTHCCSNKGRLFPYPTLIIWSLLWRENVFVARYKLNGECLELIGCWFGTEGLRRGWSLGMDRHVARMGKLKTTQSFLWENEN